MKLRLIPVATRKQSANGRCRETFSGVMPLATASGASPSAAFIRRIFSTSAGDPVAGPLVVTTSTNGCAASQAVSRSWTCRWCLNATPPKYTQCRRGVASAPRGVRRTVDPLRFPRSRHRPPRLRQRVRRSRSAFARRIAPDNSRRSRNRACPLRWRRGSQAACPGRWRDWSRRRRLHLPPERHPHYAVPGRSTRRGRPAGPRVDAKTPGEGSSHT